MTVFPLLLCPALFAWVPCVADASLHKSSLAARQGSSCKRYGPKLCHQEGVWHLPSRCLSTSCVGPLIKERLWHQYISHLAPCCKVAVSLSLGPGPPDGNRPRNRNTQRRRGPKASRDQPAAAGGGSAAADAATAEGSNAQERRAPPGEQCPSPPFPSPKKPRSLNVLLTIMLLSCLCCYV